MSRVLADVLRDNPCPNVNPYIVAEYLSHRATYGARSNAAFSAAKEALLTGELMVQKIPYNDLTPYKRGSAVNPPFERHGYTCRWIDDIGEVGIEFVDYCDKVYDGIDHTGWWADAHESDKYRGAVLRVDGTWNYLIGYEDPENDKAYLISTEVYRHQPGSPDGCGARGDSEFMREVARAADSFAENFAEEARHYDEAWQELLAAKDELREKIDDVKGVLDAMRVVNDRERVVFEDDLIEAWDEYRDAMKKLVRTAREATYSGVGYRDY